MSFGLPCPNLQGNGAEESLTGFLSSLLPLLLRTSLWKVSTVLCRELQCGNVPYEQSLEEPSLSCSENQRRDKEVNKKRAEEEGDFCGGLSSLARTGGYGLKCQPRRFVQVMKKSFLTLCISSQHRSHCFLSSTLTGSPAANHLCCPLTNLEVIKLKYFN